MDFLLLATCLCALKIASLNLWGANVFKKPQQRLQNERIFGRLHMWKAGGGQ
jgi:hypothetical protein